MVFYRFTGIITDNAFVEQCDDRSVMRQIVRNISIMRENMIIKNAVLIRQHFSPSDIFLHP